MAYSIDLRERAVNSVHRDEEGKKVANFLILLERRSMRQGEYREKAMLSRRACDRRALLGKAGNTSRRKVM